MTRALLQLGFDSVEATESIVAKAIRDGVVDGLLDHDAGYLRSNEVSDIYTSNEPQEAFKRRIRFCLDIHNEAVMAMQYPEDAHKDSFETAGVCRAVLYLCVRVQHVLMWQPSLMLDLCLQRRDRQWKKRRTSLLTPCRTRTMATSCERALFGCLSACSYPRTPSARRAARGFRAECGIPRSTPLATRSCMAHPLRERVRPLRLRPGLPPLVSRKRQY